MYESVWVKVKVRSGSDKINGNVYHPHSAPKADLINAVEIPDKFVDYAAFLSACLKYCFTF